MRKAAHSCHLYIYCGSVAYCAPTFLCGRFSNAINAIRQCWGIIRTFLTLVLHPFLGGCKSAALGVRNVMNHALTLFEPSLAVDSGVVKYLYKYRFNLPCITHWLSITTLWRSKTYCFALQKRRFCKVKAAVLQRKTYAFGKQKKKYWFSVKIFRVCNRVKWGCTNSSFAF